MAFPEIVIRACTGLMLTAGAVQDIYMKRIYTWIIAAAGIIAAVCIPFCPGISLPERMTGVLVGIFVCLLSRVTGGKIGFGDGLVLCVTGLALGFWRNMELLAVSLLAAALVSIALILLRKANRKTRIPFVPFLLFGYILQIFLL